MVDAASVQVLLNGMGTVANNISDMCLEIRQLVSTVKEGRSQLTVQSDPEIPDVGEDADISDSDNERGMPRQGSKWRRPRKRTSNKFHVCLYFMGWAGD